MPLTPLNWLINGTGIHIGLVHVGFTQHDSGKTQFVTSGKVAPISDRHAALRIPTTVVAKRIATAIIRRKKEYNYTFMGKLSVVLLFFAPDW